MKCLDTRRPPLRPGPPSYLSRDRLLLARQLRAALERWPEA
jgi:hypothetical protein